MPHRRLDRTVGETLDFFNLGEAPMTRKLVAHLTFANVVSSIALLLALGLGTAWAATELSKNQVKSRHIADGQVNNVDLANNAVTSPKVADGSLVDADFAPGEVSEGARGPEGPEGPPGPAGRQGEPGGQGATGSSAASMLSSRVFLPEYTTGTDFRMAPIAGVATGTTATENEVTMLSPPVPTVARDLTIRLFSPPAIGQRTVRLRADGVSTPLGCTVVESALACQDTNSAVPIPANTRLSLEFTGTNIVGGLLFAVPATTALVTWRATTP